MKSIINTLLLTLGFFIMVFPNSFQLVTAVLLVTITLLIFFEFRYLIVSRYFLFAWLILSGLFLFYILISEIDIKFKVELFLKYIFFPFLWLNIFTYLKANFKAEYIVRVLFRYSIFSFISVIALYFLMLNGYDYAEYFIADSNIDSEYFLGFTLHVYGNLIFFAAGIFILPDIFKNKLHLYLYVFTFILVALISARTALIMALLFGIFILLLRYSYNRNYGSLFIYILSFVILLLSVRYYVQSTLNYDVFDYFKAGSLEKLKTLGGVERTAQTSLMVNKILNNPWGVGFNNIGIERNELRTFDYEVLILAIVLRFGIIGFAAVCATLYPVFRSILNFRRINIYRRFLVVGFLSIAVFSFTNPYLESFNFQWMFFLPLVFLGNFSSERDSVPLKITPGNTEIESSYSQ